MTLEEFLADTGQFPSWLIDNLALIISALVIVGIVDLVLKAWSMWRAARMNKQVWFLALLIVNSAGILPIIFLLLTSEEYDKMLTKEAKKK